MPIVTAPSRGSSNGEVVTEFVDTVSTTPTTYTFQNTQEKLKVKNNGYAAVQVTVNGATITLLPTESKEFYGSIDSFIVVSSGGVQSFEVTGSGYKDEEIHLTILQNPNQIKNKHKILLAGLSVLGAWHFEFPMAEELFRNGYLLEACSLESLSANADSYKNQFDVLVLANTRISFYSPLTPDKLKTDVQKFMDNGVFVIWCHDNTSVTFDKKTPTNTTGSSVSVSDIFNGLTRGQLNLSSPEGTPSKNTDYPFGVTEIIKQGITINGAFANNYSSSDSSVIFPVIASNGTVTAKITAYKPQKFFVIGMGGGVNLNPKASGWYKYLDFGTLIPAVLNDTQRVRLSLDKKNGKKIAAIGVDGDATIDINTIENLLEAAGSNKNIELGLVSSKVTDDLTQLYRGLQYRFPNTYFCSHTGTHFSNPITVTDEVYTIKNQLITLKKPFRAAITSVVTSDGLTTFTKMENNLDTGLPVASQYCVWKSPYDSSIIGGGKVKFNAADEGKAIKVTYTHYDEYQEILGSINVLKSKGLVTDNGVYLTAGSNSLSGMSINAGILDDVSFSEYISFPCGFRLIDLLANYTDKMPYTHGVSMVYEKSDGYTENVDDISLLKLHSKDEIKTTIYPSVIDRCKAKELPFISYVHDVPMSDVYGSSVWLGTGYNADWKKATFVDTLAYVKEMYTWIFNRIDAENPIWVTRSEYSRRYADLNKYLSYDFKRVGNRTYIYVKNIGKKSIGGLTFKVESDQAPTAVKKLVKEKIPFSYASNVITLWFDITAGESAVIEISYSN